MLKEYCSPCIVAYLNDRGFLENTNSTNSIYENFKFIESNISEETYKNAITNLNKIDFFFILRNRIKANYKYIYASIKKQILCSTQSVNIEIAIHAHLCIIFGLRPGFRTMDDGGVLQICRDLVSFDSESEIISLNYKGIPYHFYFKNNEWI